METIEEQKKKPLPFTLPDVSKIDLNKISPKSSEPDYIAGSRGGRDFYGQASFNTGVCWLGGYVFGGAYGFVEGWRTAANPTFKIRFNSVMNSFNKRGSRAGNALGIIDLERITGLDAVTPVVAGFATGAIYKSTRGPRAAMLAGVIGAAASTVYWYGGSFVNDTILGRSGKF